MGKKINLKLSMKKFAALFLLSFLFLLIIPTSTNAQRVTKTEAAGLGQHCCSVDVDACITAAAGNDADITNCLSTHCIPNACLANNAACSTATQCPGNFCTSGKCAYSATAATECTNDSQCFTMEYCAMAATPKVCTHKQADGVACTRANECTGKFCTNNVCSAVAPAGTPPAPTAAAAAASGAAPSSQYDLPNFLGTEEPADVIGRIIKTVIGFCGILALIMFIYGGVMWLISAGREAYIDKGKDTMIWSAIGLAVVFGSYILVNFVFTFFGK